VSPEILIGAATVLTAALLLLVLRRFLSRQAIQLPGHRIAALPAFLTGLLERSLKTRLLQEGTTWTRTSPIQRRLDLFEDLHNHPADPAPLATEPRKDSHDHARSA
jgi:hypothetical protein